MGFLLFGVRRGREPKDKGVETEPQTGVKFAMPSGESKANIGRRVYASAKEIAGFDFGGPGDVAGF
jgi:hypothetical protein